MTGSFVKYQIDPSAVKRLDFEDFDTLFLKLGKDFFNLPFGLRDYLFRVLHCFLWLCFDCL